MYTYQQFGFGNYGLASAMSYLIFVVIAIVTALQFRLLRERT
jgi:multiple sugar transport system permease protein